MQDCYEEVYLKKRDLARGTFYTDGPTIEHLFNEHCSFGDARSLTVSLLLAGLTDIQRRRVELRYTGYTFREISDREHVSVQAVWQCVRRAGKKIGCNEGRLPTSEPDICGLAQLLSLQRRARTPSGDSSDKAALETAPGITAN